MWMQYVYVRRFVLFLYFLLSSCTISYTWFCFVETRTNEINVSLVRSTEVYRILRRSKWFFFFFWFASSVSKWCLTAFECYSWNFSSIFIISRGKLNDDDNAKSEVQFNEIIQGKKEKWMCDNYFTHRQNQSNGRNQIFDQLKHQWRRSAPLQMNQI